MKYDDAFCATDNTFCTPEKVASIFNNNPKQYAENLDGKLYCPDCRKVPLAFVNGNRPFFRGYPNMDHTENCFYKKDEMDPTEVKKLHDSPAGENEILHQIDRIVVQFLRDNAADLTPDSAKKSRSKGTADADGAPIKKWQADKFIPRKQLNRPFLDDDYGVEKLFYGRVHIEWEDVKDDTRKKLLIWGINTNRLICKLYITEKVYKHIPKEYLTEKKYDAFIVFLAALNRKDDNSSWSRGNLIRSNFLSINQLRTATP